MDYTSLIAEFGASYEIGDLTPDENGAVGFEADGRPVVIQKLPDSEVAIITVDLGPATDASEAAVSRIVLQANQALLALDGMAFCRHSETNSYRLLCRLDLESLDFIAFDKKMATVLGRAEQWSTFLRKFKDGAKQPAQALSLDKETKELKQEVERVRTGISEALMHRDAVKADFQGVAKAAKETILKKLCPDVSGPSYSLSEAVERYNGIFANHKIDLYFAEDGALATRCENTLAKDFEKLLDALIRSDDKLRKDLKCEVPGKDTFTVLDDFYKKLPQDKFDDSILMNPLDYFIPSEPLNPKKNA